MDTESIFERMARCQLKGVPVRSAVVDHGNPGAWHGQKATTCLACASDADIVAGLCGTIGAHHFLFGRLTALADVRGCASLPSSPSPPYAHR